MDRRARRPGRGDISGKTHGDFTDWDNPEDADDGAPEGYYDADDDSYVPDEDDPDYDLSEVHGYSNWEPSRTELIPRWVLAAASILLIVAILIPLLIRIS